MAIIEDITTRRQQKGHFGSRQPLMEHYRDHTGLGLYRSLNHLDPKRKKNYLARHAKTLTKKWSPSYFSAKYLWDAKI